MAPLQVRQVGQYVEVLIVGLSLDAHLGRARARARVRVGVRVGVGVGVSLTLILALLLALNLTLGCGGSRKLAASRDFRRRGANGAASDPLELSTHRLVLAWG